MDKKDDTPVLSILRAMAVGQTHTFSADRGSYVKSACTTFGFEWNKKFTTTVNRAERTISVTRVS